MDILHRIILYLHITSVILSVGPFFILIPVTGKLRKSQGKAQQAYLDVFRFAVLLGKHAGHVLVVTGILLVTLSSWTWKTPWILVTVGIMVSSLFFLARAFSPTIRKFDEEDIDTERFVNKLNRAVWIYLVLLMLMLWFMVTKPVLW